MNKFEVDIQSRKPKGNGQRGITVSGDHGTPIIVRTRTRISLRSRNWDCIWPLTLLLSYTFWLLSACFNFVTGSTQLWRNCDHNLHRQHEVTMILRLTLLVPCLLAALIYGANADPNAGSLYPPGLMPLIQRADVLLSAGQYNDAVKTYSEAIGKHCGILSNYALVEYNGAVLAASPRLDACAVAVNAVTLCAVSWSIP